MKRVRIFRKFETRRVVLMLQVRGPGSFLMLLLMGLLNVGRDLLEHCKGKGVNTCRKSTSDPDMGTDDVSVTGLTPLCYR